MLYLITGLPRNGKSFYVMKKFLAELKHGKRPIYTNLPIFIDEIAKWCAKNGCAGAEERITKLTAPQVRKFWHHRPNPPTPGPSQDECLIFDNSNSIGVVYYIDEVHIPFHSHRWAEVSTECPYYISQHGKLKDDIYLITQHIDKLAKQLKLDVQYYIEIEYLRRQLLLFFQKGYHFRATGYTGGVPENDREKGKPDQKWPFWPDSAVMRCYDSNAGNGVVGTGKEHGNQHFKGLAPYWLWSIAALSLYLCFATITKVPAWVLGKISDGKDKAKSAAVSGTKDEKKTGVVEPPKSNASVTPSPVVTPPKLQELDGPIPLGLQVPTGKLPEEPLWIRGMSASQKGNSLRYYILLSDNRVLTHRDGTVKRIDPSLHYVDLVDGRRVWLNEAMSPRTTPLQTWEPEYREKQALKFKAEEGPKLEEPEKPAEPVIAKTPPAKREKFLQPAVGSQ